MKLKKISLLLPLVFCLAATSSKENITEESYPLQCKGIKENIRITGTFSLSVKNKPLPGRNGNEKLPPGLMKEYEYRSASAQLQIKFNKDGEAVEFSAAPTGEGYPEEGNLPASATLRQEGSHESTMINPDNEGSVDIFYLYGSGPSEITITYRSDLKKKAKFSRRTERFEMNCEIGN